MLTDLIIRYLESNKRLVVPQLGAFVVKAAEGCILFTELFRRDDGVLRSLLCAEGMSELEAAGAVDRFVFEVRHAVQEGCAFPMEGFGVFRGGPDDTIVFVYEPKVHASSTPSGAVLEAPIEASTGSVSSASEAALNSEQPAPAGTRSVKQTAEDTSASSRPDDARTSTPKLRPDPSVKGLRYGKPLKTTDAYTYVGAAPRRKVDRLILFALAAAVVALAAIAYGYIRDLQAERDDVYLEQPLPPAEHSAAETSIQTE